MLEVICGPMYSGKSTELIRRLDRASIAGKEVLLLRPEVDNRFSDDFLITHSGASMSAEPIGNAADFQKKTLWNKVEVIGIDEAQFLPEYFIDQIDLVARFRKVIVAGLDTTYRVEPFGIMPHLMCIADRVDKLSAVCHVCGEDAVRTQRLIDGKPAPFDGPTVLVGATDAYEARCREHYEVG